MEASLFTELSVPSYLLGCADYNAASARTNLSVTEHRFRKLREIFWTGAPERDPKGEELEEALRQYERRMNEDYAPDGAVEVLTPDAAELDDDQGE